VKQVGSYYTAKATCILQYVNFTSQLSTLSNATVPCTFYDSSGLEITNLDRNILS